MLPAFLLFAWAPGPGCRPIEDLLLRTHSKQKDGTERSRLFLSAMSSGRILLPLIVWTPLQGWAAVIRSLVISAVLIRGGRAPQRRLLRVLLVVQLAAVLDLCQAGFDLVKFRTGNQVLRL